MENKEKKYISLVEASRLCPYSPEYLRLLARQKKIDSKRIGRNWFTTAEAIQNYVAKQSLTIVIPKSALISSEEGINTSQIKFGRLSEVDASMSDVVELSSAKELQDEINKIQESAKGIIDELGEYKKSGQEFNLKMNELQSLVSKGTEKIEEIDLALKKNEEEKEKDHERNAAVLQSLSGLNEKMESLKKAEEEKAEQPRVISVRTDNQTTEKLDTALNAISENLENITELQKGQMERIFAMELEQVKSRSSDQLPEKISASLEKIAENLNQLSAIQDLQVKQIEVQSKAVESKLTQIPKEGIEKIQGAIEKTNERTEMILAKIQEGLAQLVKAREIEFRNMEILAQSRGQSQETERLPAQAISVTFDQKASEEIKSSLDKITENLKQLSLIQNLQLKQIQFQQQALDKAILQNLEARQNQIENQTVQAAPVAVQLSQTANKEYLSERTDRILGKIYSAVDRLVQAQELQMMEKDMSAKLVSEQIPQHQTEIKEALEKIGENLETLNKNQQIKTQAEVQPPVSIQTPASPSQTPPKVFTFHNPIYEGARPEPARY